MKEEFNLDKQLFEKMLNSMEDGLLSPDDILSQDEDETMSGFLEGMPEEGDPLYGVLSDNGILTAEQRARYGRYDRGNPGCSKEGAIVISETVGYVHLEYEVLECLLEGNSRHVDYRVIKQRLIEEGGRYYDELLVETSSLDGEKGDEVTAVEEYWFDITAGFNSLSLYCGR